MSLDKAYFEKELNKKQDELEELDQEIEGFEALIAGAKGSKTRIGHEIGLIKEYLALLEPESEKIVPEAPVAE